MAIFSKLFSKIRAGSSSPGDWEEIEEALIASDLGAKSAAEIVEIAKKSKVDQIDEAITASLQSWLSKNNREIAFNADRQTTVMIVGVNGT